MPKNVVITPLSGLVDFYDLNSNLDAKIQIDDPGNLSITNSGGTLTLGNTAANVVIGDGVSNVDMIFEQNGAIRGATGRTLTLGSSASNVTIASPLTINSPIVNTTTTGYFEVRQTVSTWTSSNSHPIIKWDFNATYDDHLYLASGGNTGGTGQSALIIGETNISIGKANSNPNSTSVLSTTAVTINASTGGISTTGVIISSGSNFRVATGSDAGGNLNLGRIDNVASAPYIDFNSGATSVDFDVRLAATGGNGTAGNGLLTLTGNLSLTGNLTVNGTTTTVNSTTVTVDDPIFTLGGDVAPTVDDNKDRGIEFRWHNGTAAKVGFFGYDDSTGYLTFIPDATNTSEVFSGTQGDIQASNFRGALVGNASTATTLQTARNINGVSFNGSTDITVADSTKLPLSGGTLTGALTVPTVFTVNAQGAEGGEIVLKKGTGQTGLSGDVVLDTLGSIFRIFENGGTFRQFTFDLTTGNISGVNGILANINGNAATVTNGVVTTGSYANPSWITSLSETKVLPSQTGHSGKYLTTNGTATSWSTVSGGINYTRITSNTTLVDKQGVIADTSGGTFTVTLPASPTVGVQVSIVDGNNWAITTLTVARNANTIEGLAEDLILDIGGAKVDLIYDGTTWEVYTQVGVGGSAVDLNTAQTLTNKTINFNNNTLTGVASTTTAQTLTNKTLTSPVISDTKITGLRETTTVSATAATGTINYDYNTQSVLYYTTNASGNFTINVRGDSGTTLNSKLAVGESVTIVFMNTNGATAYYHTGFQIDGTSVTPKWQGGTAPSSGNINSIDIYTYTIIKTASTPSYTVLASQTKFA